MVLENDITEKESNGVAFIKFINCADLINKDAEIQNWYDYQEWHDYWNDYR